MTDSERANKVARGAGILLPAMLIGSIGSLIADLLVNGALPLDEYGVYHTSRRLQNLAFIVALLGMETTVVRFVAAATTDAHRRGAFRQPLLWTIVASTALTAVIWVFAAPLASLVDPHPSLPSALRIAALALPFAAARTAATSASQGMLVIAHRAMSVQMVLPFAQIAFVGLLVYGMGMGVQGALWSLVIGVAAGTALALTLLSRNWPDFLDPRAPSDSDAKQILAFSLPLWGFALAHWGFTWVDQVLVAALAGMDEAGKYGPITALAPFFAVGLTAINGVFAPMIARLVARRRRKELTQLYRTATRWALILTLPVTLFVLAQAELILAMWPNGRVEAADAMRLVALGQCAWVVVGSVNYLLMMHGRPWQVLLNALPALALNLLLCWFWIPEYGVVGAGGANAAARTLSSAIGMAQVWILLGLHPYHRAMFRLVPPTLVAGVVAMAWSWMPALHPILLATTGGVATAATFALTLFATGLTDADRDLLASLRK